MNQQTPLNHLIKLTAQAAAENDDRHGTITVCPHHDRQDIARKWKDAYAQHRMSLSGEASA